MRQVYRSKPLIYYVLPNKIGANALKQVQSLVHIRTLPSGEKIFLSDERVRYVIENTLGIELDQRIIDQ